MCEILKLAKGTDGDRNENVAGGSDDTERGQKVTHCAGGDVPRVLWGHQLCASAHFSI